MFDGLICHNYSKVESTAYEGEVYVMAIARFKYYNCKSIMTFKVIIWLQNVSNVLWSPLPNSQTNMSSLSKKGKENLVTGFSSKLVFNIAEHPTLL